MYRWRQQEDGFVLLEVLFAAGILVVTLALVAGALVSVMDANKMSEARDIAVTRLASAMEQLYPLDRDSLLSAIPEDLVELKTGDSILVEALTSAGEPITVPVEDPEVARSVPDAPSFRVTVWVAASRGRIVTSSAVGVCAR